jgi:threonine/homoserine/homoserine lactone efflux protein
MLPASTNLLLACSAYAIGVASPGPSNLAIMGLAMRAGRRPALLLALGIVSGSMFWGLLAAFGLSALLAAYAGLLVALKIMGGLYLLWLALRSARAAIGPHAELTAGSDDAESALQVYLRGAAMHVTNPKAIFVWLSIVSLAVPPGAKAWDALQVVLGCLPLGLAIFCGYACLFSVPMVRRGYLAVRRGFEAGLAAVFGYAGLRLLIPMAHLRGDAH